jgi:hypothetical protein
MYGKAPATIWTRLAANANIGDNTLTVVQSSGWAVGDTIVLGPTENNATEMEEFTIKNI